MGMVLLVLKLILLAFFVVTKMASGRGVSLPLWLWFIAKIQAGGTLDSAVTGIWRFCIRCLSALPTSVPQWIQNGIQGNLYLWLLLQVCLRYCGVRSPCFLWWDAGTLRGCEVHCLGRSRWGNLGCWTASQLNLSSAWNGQCVFGCKILQPTLQTFLLNFLKGTSGVKPTWAVLHECGHKPLQFFLV